MEVNSKDSTESCYGYIAGIVCLDACGKVDYNCSMSKVRVDILLVERGLVDSRSQAQRLVMAGQVRADGQVVKKPSVAVSQDVELTIDTLPKYVSRGGEKLAPALETFAVDVSEQVCADVGASTGGFTDCLLQHGAVRVYAIDVGQGLLHWNLRQNDRVVVMEGINARYQKDLPEPISLITIDVSFISIKALLPVVRNWFHANGGQVIALIKPQFEAGRKETSRGKGVIRDPEVHRQVLREVLSFAQEQGFTVNGLIQSPLVGPKGNVEFFTHLQYPSQFTREIQPLIEQVITE
jgi:23S rRNA (cytidine1920-2'-O)/16S rRNA (cytidine1409-2'-O)-methyltransferase